MFIQTIFHLLCTSFRLSFLLCLLYHLLVLNAWAFITLWVLREAIAAVLQRVPFHSIPFRFDSVPLLVDMYLYCVCVLCICTVLSPKRWDRSEIERREKDSIQWHRKAASNRPIHIPNEKCIRSNELRNRWTKNEILNHLKDEERNFRIKEKIIKTIYV